MKSLVKSQRVSIVLDDLAAEHDVPGQAAVEVGPSCRSIEHGLAGLRVFSFQPKSSGGCGGRWPATPGMKNG